MDWKCPAKGQQASSSPGWSCRCRRFLPGSGFPAWIPTWPDWDLRPVSSGQPTGQHLAFLSHFSIQYYEKTWHQWHLSKALSKIQVTPWARDATGRCLGFICVWALDPILSIVFNRFTLSEMVDFRAVAFLATLLAISGELICWNNNSRWKQLVFISQEYSGHQSSGAFQAGQQVFCFNFKNGLQNFEFLFFNKCIYVFCTKPCVQWWENPKKQVRAPEFWCPGTSTLVPAIFLTV